MNKLTVWLYLVFGILTTLINIVSFIILVDGFKINYIMATSVSWVLSIVFAFVTNKFYVFKNRDLRFNTMIREIILFTSSRIASLLVDAGLMILLIELMNINQFWTKIVVNVFVVIINFIFSKMLFLKQNYNKRNEENESRMVEDASH